MDTRVDSCEFVVSLRFPSRSKPASQIRQRHGALISLRELPSHLRTLGDGLSLDFLDRNQAVGVGSIDADRHLFLSDGLQYNCSCYYEQFPPFLYPQGAVARSE